MSRSLPPRSSLRQLRRQAKDLFKAYRAGAPEAVARFRAAIRRLAAASNAEVIAAGLTLQDAQHVLAVEYGFGTWSALHRHVEHAAGDSLEAARAAIAVGDEDRLVLLLKGEPDLARRRIEEQQATEFGAYTLLHLAAVSNSAATVRLLLAGGADANSRCGEGWTALHLAAEGDHVANVQVLLEAGADVQLEACGDGGTPLAHALFSGARASAAILAQQAVVPSNLRVAAGLGDVARLQSFFGDGSKLRPSAGRGRGFYRHHAEYPEWTPSAEPQEILDEALVYACMNGRRAALELLLERGANVNGMPYTMTGLHAAVQQGDLALAKLLLERGADPTLRDRMHGGTPYGWSQALDRHALRDLLRPNGIEEPTTALGSDGGLFEAIDAGLERRVGECLKLGADPNATRSRSVPLSGRGMAEVTQTALQAAAEAAQRPIGERLAAAGARLDLHAAAFLDRVPLLSELLGEGHPDGKRDDFGRTPLHRAIQGGAEAAVRWLIERGASVETHADTFSFGQRALHVAAAAGASARLIDLLIAAGADVNEAVNPGTPLRVALQRGKHETASALRARGAT